MGKSSGGLSGEDRELAAEAIDYYVSGNGYGLNYSLRNGTPVYGEDALLMRGLDIATSQSIGEQTLYRGISAKALFGDSIEGKFGLLKSGVVNGYNDADVADFVKKQTSKVVGKKFTDKGFMSTTKKASVAESFGGEQQVILKMRTSTRTKGRDLDKDRGVYKNNTYEKEVLLRRGTSYTIKRVYAKNGFIYADATIG